jgi:hypothetical protein
MSSYLKPSTKGMRDPLDNGPGPEGKIANPPRFAQLGGLTSASKVGPRNKMSVRKPGASESK